MFPNASNSATMSPHLQHMRIWTLFYAVEILTVACCCSAVITRDGYDKTPFCQLIQADRGRFEVSFLSHQTDSSASLRFYWSRWTSEQSVEDCFTSTDETLIARYLSMCEHRERAKDAAERLLHFNLSVILEDDSLCEFKINPLSRFPFGQANVNQNQRSIKIRQKRALFVLPGTLWCGRGTSANNYEQLGMFEHADRCCREHDHCEHIIRAFSVNYGVFNSKLFTISHCDCDHRFKQCLLAGNDTISNMVGYSFFNVLKIHCFELSQRKRCTQFNWFGACTSVQIAPVAVMKDPTPYNSTDLNNESSDITDLSCNKEPIKSLHNGKQRTSKSKQMRLHKEHKACDSVKHAKKDAFQHQRFVKKYDKKKKIQKTSPRKRKKAVLSNSHITLTPSPRTHASVMNQRISLKNKLEIVLQNIERALKARVTPSPSSVSVTKSLLIQKTSNAPSKQTSITKSSLQRKKNKGKSVKSRKPKKFKPYAPFNPSRGDHFQQKHHRGKNT
nr:group 3 secretory phospholipase A2 [Misgurnus anguillicaudatus]